MKKFYLLLFSFIFSIFVYGQEEYHKPFGKNYFPQKEGIKDFQKAHRQKFSYQQLNQSFIKNANQELQRLDSLLGYIYNDTALYLDFKEEYMYNENDLIIKYEAFFRDELTDEWVLDGWEEYEYNDAGNLLLYYDYEYDSLSQQWFAGWKKDYVYDDNNLLVQTFESWKDDPGEEWYFVWRVDFTYDENNRPLSTLEYIYTLDWSLSRSSQYTYDENGNLTQFELFDDDDAGGWVNEIKEVYVYDDNNRLMEFTDYEWDATIEEWIETDREVYTYSDNNNVDFYVDYNWNESDNNWVEFWREEFTYENTYPYDQLVLPWFYHDDVPNFMNHQLIEHQGYSFLGSEWVPFSKGEYYYSSGPSTSVTDVSKTDIKFYPNPASTEITFRFGSPVEAGLQVYDLTGNLVRTMRVWDNKPVNIGQLSDGLYLFRLTGEGNKPIFSEKILVK